MENTNNTVDANNTGANKTVLMKLSLPEMSVTTALYILLVLGALLGNSLILAAFAVNKKLRTITHTLVMGLAVSDMLVGLVSIPCWMYIALSEYNGKRNNTDVIRFYSSFDIFIGIASILQLTSISIERCHAVVRPLQHRTLPKHIFYVMIAFPWLYAALMGFLHPVQYQSWESTFTILMTVTCFFIPFMVIIIAYISIYRNTRQSRAIIKRHNTLQKRIANKELQLSITVALITTLFVITWLPLFLVTLIATYSLATLGVGLSTTRLVMFVKWMHYSNSAVNPYVYSYRNQGIRNTLGMILCKLFCRKYEPVIYKQESIPTLSCRSLSSRSKKRNYGEEKAISRVEMCSSV